MKFKGTKGKWSVGVAPEYNNTLKSAMIEIHTNNVWVCKVQNNGIIQSEEGNYNALLISKAPEMLEMLKESTEVIKWYMENSTSELSEPFFNIGANQIEQTGQLINQATEL